MVRPAEREEVQRRAAAPRIFITMPAYRAERTLARTVADIPAGLEAELILVDDASPDRTVERARELGVRVFVHSRNRGYGGNQKSCYSIALEHGADIVVLLHPDYQYDPKAVPLLIAPILAGDADMTFGSRFAGLGDPRSGGMPLYRYVGNRVTTLLENLMLKARFTEMHSGMRAYSRECLLELPFRGYSDEYVFDSHLLVDAVSSGHRVVEVPIPTRYTEESSSISVLRSLRYVSESVLYAARQTWTRGRRGRRWPPAISSLRQGRSLGHGTPLPIVCPLCDANIRVAFSTNLIQCLNCGLVSSQGESKIIEHPTNASLDEFSRTLARLTGFWLPGRDMAIIGEHAERLSYVAQDLGWNARAASLVEVPDGRWNVILLSDVIADIPEPVAALRSLSTSLSPEGLLAMTCPTTVSRFRRVAASQATRRHCFGDATLHATLRRGGFRPVDWVPSIGRTTLEDAEPLALVLSRKSASAEA
jgi:hypothetical protein